MIILKILGLILLLLVLPTCIGMLPSYYIKSEYTKGCNLIFGYITMLAILELVGIPTVILANVGGYRIFMLVFGIALILAAFFGVYLNRLNLNKNLIKGLGGNLKNGVASIKSLSLESKFYLVLIFICIIIQLVMLYVYASMDADDFYYNAQALTSQQFGTMYRIDENTGRSIPLDVRHALAMFPMLQAFISSVTKVHVAIFAHKIFPLVIIPLSYYLLYKIGEVLFPNKKEAQLLFTLLMNVWRVFGFVSYYTTETFFLLRTWQGKSIAGNFILPAILWLFLIFRKSDEEKTSKRFYMILALTIMASGSSSSLAVMLSCILTGMLAFLFLLFDRKKDVKAFISQLLCCIPGIIYMLIYVLAR